MNIKEKMIGVVVGIRFKRSFRVPDISGEIIDDILYSDKSPFDSKFFPQVQEGARERILVNDETTEYLRINRDDIILGLVIEDNFDERFNWIKEEVLPYFKDVLFKKYGIKNIIRIGIIFSHKLKQDSILNTAVKLVTKESIEGVENINISFSKKLSSIEALYRKGVDDYKNSIYNFTEKGDELLAELDYQYYYNPPIEDLRECFTENVLDDAKTFLETQYYPWLINDKKNEVK